MPISLARAQKHVEVWTTSFGRYPIAYWPACLFHAAQIEVGVEIVRAGGIICRNQQSSMVCDVANQGALGNNIEAHGFARLYFRPRNGFHLKTEGIKSIGDPYRLDPHMTIPVMFVFDFVKLITSPKVVFTKGNFARNDTPVLDGDASFDQLDFSLIYHDSNPGNRMAEIHNLRMSEVIIPDFLPLTYLSSVVCRTTHEERMFRHLLDRYSLTQPVIKVAQSGSVFFKTGIFIDEMSIIDRTLHICFHAPTKAIKESYCVTVNVRARSGLSKTGTWNIANGRWSFPALKSDPDSIWQIIIEGCTAYEGPVPSNHGLIT